MEEKPKLEWMYKTGQDLVNREDYLLGKKVDKQFEETIGNIERVLPQSIVRSEIIASSSYNKHEDQIDILR